MGVAAVRGQQGNNMQHQLRGFLILVRILSLRDAYRRPPLNCFVGNNELDLSQTGTFQAERLRVHRVGNLGQSALRAGLIT